MTRVKVTSLRGGGGATYRWFFGGDHGYRDFVDGVLWLHPDDPLVHHLHAANRCAERDQYRIELEETAEVTV